MAGGTGFVGSHSVAALVAAGHELRLLVRSAGKAESVLSPLGVQAAGIELVEGDATDEQLVRRAVAGCDAMLNCVSMVSLNRRDRVLVREVNIGSARTMLQVAADAGLDPIVHVSSMSALLPPMPAGTVLTENAPVGSPPGAYMSSKADADRLARSMQDAGAPVVLTYPNMVVGPHDPSMGEGMGTLAMVLRGQVPALPPGGMEIIDVRDVAAVHAAVMEAGRGPRRYIVNGTHRSARQLVGDLRRLTGRRLPFAPVPTALVAAIARAGEAIEPVIRVTLPLTPEKAWVLALDARSDDTTTRRELGLGPRPLDDTLRDTVRWMAASGVITERQAGRI